MSEELTQEEEYQLKLIKLVNKVTVQMKYLCCYEYATGYKDKHAFRVWDIPLKKHIIIDEGHNTASECYRWAIEQCEEKGFYVEECKLKERLEEKHNRKN